MSVVNGDTVVKGYQIEHEVYTVDGKWYDTKVVEIGYNDTIIYTEECPLDADDYKCVYIREVDIDTNTGEVEETSRGYYHEWVG